MPRITYQKDFNLGRAYRAEEALKDYNDQYELEGLDTVLVDLLADLMHLCQLKDIDFERQLDTARGHFGEEFLPYGNS